MLLIFLKENETQKEVEDYLKEKQQLIIFAYKNNPAYQTSNGQTHTILNISTLPIVEISYNTLTLLYKNTQKSFQIDNTIMPELIKDIKEDKQYELGFNKTNDYLVLKSNKLYKIYKDNSNNITQSSLNNTQESNSTQNNQNPNNTQTSNTQRQTNTDSLYLKESKDFEEIKNILELTKEENYQSVKVWVEVEELRLSGKEWVKEYKEKEGQSEENLLNDLDSDFRKNVTTFINILRNAGASVVVTSTRRSKKRAVLMHYAWRISVSKDITPQQAQQETQKENIPINWIHTDSNGNYSEEISREKALEMVKAYRMRDRASLTSNHILGKAIDMTITWQSSFTIKDKIGNIHTIDTPRNGAENEMLKEVGKTYGVKRTLEKDPPHWSLEGN